MPYNHRKHPFFVSSLAAEISALDITSDSAISGKYPSKRQTYPGSAMDDFCNTAVAVGALIASMESTSSAKPEKRSERH